MAVDGMQVRCYKASMGNEQIIIIYFFVFIFGLTVGSFLNVCIVRLPRGKSVVSPGSHCPTCGEPVRWYDNLPLLSFILLGGRCRGCRSWIGIRYPLVELLTGVLSILVYLRFPEALPWAIWFTLFTAPLIAITFIDLEHMIIPDVFSLSGIVLGLAARPLLAPAGSELAEFLDGVYGVFAGGGFLFVVGYVYEKLRGQEGLGGGDVKLAGMLGAFLGWQAMPFVLLASAMLGSIVGLTLMAVKREGGSLAIPYGPFLSVGGLLYMFVGEKFLDWYLGLFL